MATPACPCDNIFERLVLVPTINNQLAGRKLIMILLFIGCIERHPGPPQAAADDGRRGLRVGTLNTPGLHVLRRNRMGSVEEEGWGDGFQLLTDPGRALRAVRALFAQGDMGVGVLTETRTHGEEMAAVAGYMGQARYGCYGTPGVMAEGSAHTTGGVSIIWDAKRLRATNKEVLIAGRLLKVELEMLGSAERMVVIGAYMPNRQCAADVVEPAWDALILAATSAGARAVVAGDLNAELRRQVEAKGARMTRADELLAELISSAALQATGTGMATHKKGGEIDHVLVHQAMAGATSKARILPGVTANDHKCAYVEITHHVDTTGSGPPREVGPRLGSIAHSDERWTKYRTAVGNAVAGACLEGSGGVVERARKLHAIMTTAQAAAFSDDKGGGADGGGAGRRRGSGGTRKDRREAARWRIAKWEQMGELAAKWRGARPVPGDRSGLARDPMLRRLMTAAPATSGERRRAVAGMCQRQLARAEVDYDAAAGLRDGDEMVRSMQVAVQAGAGGGVTKKVFDVVRACLAGAAGALGDTKLAEVLPNVGGAPDREAEPLRGAAAVREEARKYGAETMATGRAHTVTARRMLAHVWGGAEVPPWEAGRGLEAAVGWESFVAALAKADKSKAVGADGFNMYLLRMAPAEVQELYWHLLREMVSTSTYPAEYRQWTAMLAMKPGEDARDLTRRRDLWVTCHAQKLLMRMLNTEYERAADEAVPGSAAGFTRGRNGPEGTLVLRLAQEQSMLEGTPLFVGFLDFGTFFMSCVKEIQWEVERWTGVDPAVSDVVRELHREVSGKYETAYGLTEGFGIDKGTGQGCVNGAVRAKLQIGVLQRMISKHVPGYRFTGAHASVPQGVYADDAAYVCHDMAALQLAFDTSWMMAKVCGLPIKIKGKSKTAYFATYWEGGIEKDVAGYELRLADGRLVPQILKRPKHPLPPGAKGDVHSYKHLGTELAPGWNGGMEEARSKVVTRCTQVVKLIGRIPVLTSEQMDQMVSLAIGGVIGYYGRATPLRWSDCQKIERARAYAMHVRGFTPTVPRVQMYAAPTEGGLGHAHAYQAAAAALIDQVDRALCGGDGEPARVAVEAAIASTCWRLGCRADPLAWDPQHVRAALSEDMMVEAWLLAKMRTGLVGLPTGVPLRVWRPDGGDGKGPMLWEAGGGTGWQGSVPCRYRKRMAEVGMVWWADVTDPRTGGWLSWGEARRKFGARLNGVADKRDYEGMLADAGTAANAQHVQRWRAHVAVHGLPQGGLGNGGRGVRVGEEQWEHTAVLGAREAPASFGGWEYRMRWRDWEGGDTWETAHALRAAPSSALARELAEARDRRRVPHSLRAHLEGLNTHKGATERAKGRRLLRACETDGADDATVGEAFSIYTRYAARLSGGANVAERDNLDELPRAKGQRGEALPVDECQVMYLGGRRVVNVPRLGGGVEREERSCTGLEPSTARDAALPAELRVTEGAAREAVEAEGAAIAEDAVRAMEGLPAATRRGMWWWTSDVVDCARESACSFWRTGGSDTGYTEIGNNMIARCPVLRLFLRSDDVEVRGGVLDANGVRIECDDEEKKALRGGAEHCWWVRWVCLNLHAWHDFTHAVATDGSLKTYADGSTRLAVGLWEGVQPLDEDTLDEDGRRRLEEEGEREESIQSRVGAGLWGAALPAASLDTIVDAEMYAVLLYLRKMAGAGAADAGARRCLVLVDCKPALQAIEGAWRRGRIETGRGGDRGAMLEEICRLRATLGRVVFLWVPSHVGISPNSMADAAAKTYLGQPVDEAGVASIAAAVRTRPCLYAASRGGGAAPALRDKRVYAEAYTRSKAWVCEQLRKGTTSGIVMGMEGRLWPGLVKRVGAGMALRTDGEDRGTRGGGERRPRRRPQRWTGWRRGRRP